MDYLFLSSVQDSDLRSFVVSYDIACQWHKNIWKRMDSYPNLFNIDHNGPGPGLSIGSVRFFVPKFHLPAHILACHNNFSFNLGLSVGRTDGEAPERGWAHINPVATSTKEMSPGHRRDTLDDHFSDWNWKKVVGMGESFYF
jgi:hypothetical protein